MKKVLSVLLIVSIVCGIAAVFPEETVASECPPNSYSVGWPVSWEQWPAYQLAHPTHFEYGSSSDYGPHLCAPIQNPTQPPVETEEPTAVVTEEPTEVVTEEPTEVVTEEPTEVVTEEPTEVVTEEPTLVVVETTPPPQTDVVCITNLSAPIVALMTSEGQPLPLSVWTQVYNTSTSQIVIRLFDGHYRNSLLKAALSNGETVDIQFTDGWADIKTEQQNCWVVIADKEADPQGVVTPTVEPCGEFNENCPWLATAYTAEEAAAIRAYAGMVFEDTIDPGYCLKNIKVETADQITVVAHFFKAGQEYRSAEPLLFIQSNVRPENIWCGRWFTVLTPDVRIRFDITVPSIGLLEPHWLDVSANGQFNPVNESWWVFANDGEQDGIMLLNEADRWSTQMQRFAYNVLDIDNMSFQQFQELCAETWGEEIGIGQFYPWPKAIVMASNTLSTG